MLCTYTCNFFLALATQRIKLHCVAGARKVATRAIIAIENLGLAFVLAASQKHGIEQEACP